MRALLGTIVPHAPLLVPDLESPEVAEAARRIRVAVPVLDLPDTIVIVSPHGARSGVYARPAGSLDAFGASGMTIDAPGDPEMASALAKGWGRDLLEEPADHGVVVPMLLGCIATRVVGVALVERAPLDEIETDAESLAEALMSFAGSTVALVASINGAAGLGARAPLTARPRSKELDESLRHALAREPERVGPVARELARTEASCCLGPLTTLIRALPRASFDIRAHEAPVGVSYLVARSTDAQ